MNYTCKCAEKRCCEDGDAKRLNKHGWSVWRRKRKQEEKKHSAEHFANHTPAPYPPSSARYFARGGEGFLDNHLQENMSIRYCTISSVLTSSDIGFALLSSRAISGWGAKSYNIDFLARGSVRISRQVVKQTQTYRNRVCKSVIIQTIFAMIWNFPQCINSGLSSL